MSIQPARLLRPLATAIALSFSIATIPAAIAAPTPTVSTLSHKNSSAEIGGIGTQALLDTVTTLPLMEGINLSDDQYSQLYTVVDTTREQMVSVISIEQQTQFQTTLDRSGGDFDAAVKAMNLSDQQKSQLDFIVQVFGFQAASILTPEQQRIISANIEGL
jgi:Spy/CpxP family protein refolding chaperone